MGIYNPPHPGRALKACFDEEFTVEMAAQSMGVSVNALLDIIEGKAPITNEIAFLLTRAIPESNPSLWIALQADYDAWQVTHNRKWQNKILKAHRLLPELPKNIINTDSSTVSGLSS